MVSFGHCIACPSLISGFWLPLWYLLAIVVHVRLWYLASDYPFGIFWPLHSMSVFDIRLLITSLWYLLAIVLDVRLWYPASDYFPLVSFGHCSACPSLISGFWLPLWYLLAIVLDVRLWYLASDYPFGIFWPLYCMSVFDIWLLITPLVSFGHCIALSVFDIWLLITPLVSFGHCIACPSLISGFWLPLWYLLAIVLDVRLWYRLLITPLVSFGHCIGCPSLIFGFWLPLWYLLAIVLHVRLWYSASDYPFGIFWPLYCMSVFDIWLLITPLVSFGHCIALSVFDIWLLITPLVSFGHCIACPSLISGFWLPLWYLLAIVVHVRLWYLASDYPFGIFWPLHSMSVFDIRLLITPLIIPFKRVLYWKCTNVPTWNYYDQI